MRGVVYKNGKVLAVKHLHDDKEVDYWAIPGGGLNDGESFADGLKREMIEELGVSPAIGKLLFMQQYNDPKWNREKVDLFFLIENPEDFEQIDFHKTTHGDIEIAKLEFIDPKKEPLLPEFLREIDIADYVECDKPVIVKSHL